VVGARHGPPEQPWLGGAAAGAHLGLSLRSKQVVQAVGRARGERPRIKHVCRECIFEAFQQHRLLRSLGARGACVLVDSNVHNGGRGLDMDMAERNAGAGWMPGPQHRGQALVRSPHDTTPVSTAGNSKDSAALGSPSTRSVTDLRPVMPGESDHGSILVQGPGASLLPAT
jgi:hypothetical protein